MKFNYLYQIFMCYMKTTTAIFWLRKMLKSVFFISIILIASSAIAQDKEQVKAEIKKNSVYIEVLGSALFY